MEKYLSLIPGVLETEVGYANGKTANPTYEEVCYNDTGHAETVRVVYDASRLPLRELLFRFFDVIDPTSVNKQGHDTGVQYRTGIYYTEPEDKLDIHSALAALQAQYENPVVVEVRSLENFYPAETGHQRYLDQHPGGYCHIPAGAFERAKKPVACCQLSISSFLRYVHIFTFLIILVSVIYPLVLHISRLLSL